GQKTGNAKVRVLAETLEQATSQFLEQDKSPSRKVNELDNRGSHFYLALYWAQALAAQDKDADLKSQFSDIAQQLTQREQVIVAELNAAQGKPVDIGGYYHCDPQRAAAAMRPSSAFNEILSSL
ncbi:MAG: NADP-dependent isocitrate dehydrogenase, partial [Planctomycetales bacterium]|nr:NADP-dependent isocitrate dehydrogenase [Planctomycetales bacterium]